MENGLNLDISGSFRYNTEIANIFRNKVKMKMIAAQKREN